MVQRETAKSALSADLKRVVGADHIVLRKTAVLKKADAARLAALLGQKQSKGPDALIDRKRALAALARSAPLQRDTADILGRLLVDETADPSERLAAASYLGALSTDMAERPLIAALRQARGPFRSRVLKSLAQVGSASAFRLLRDLEPENAAEARQLALATAAIAAREPGLVSPDYGKAFGLEWAEAKAEPLDRKSLAAVHAGLSGPLFSMAPSAKLGLGYTCGKTRFTLLLNDSLDQNDIPKAVMAREWIAASMVTQAGNAAHWTLRWLVLTQPVADGLRMVLLRPNGDAMFEGMAQPGKDGMNFHLRDTGLERIPTQIDGRILRNGLSWTHKVWRGPLRAKKRPLPLAI
ncbi:HEAT repeat domain-containing protein [Meridianimarinicoccus aquatilis]|uniref:HEAT repeat domain-containing protein n=1 Tax=Meridianimarinicoccus aquatilis TaxID=2552766 RepID=A0A4R6B3H4_9RHOB|nr:hypothetical protein [Fluviibacterium aquatile]TDL90784.1 hypothetical protein E2L05_03200 [Fluviibacterium aquatile]